MKERHGQTCPACSARLDRQAPTCPNCDADLAAVGANQATRSGAVDQEARTIAVAAHLSTFAGLVVPFGSVIGPLAVWLRRRERDPFIDDAGREALNFGISIAVYGLVALVAALMLVGIPLLIAGVIAWVVLASLAAVRASQGQSYRYPLTMRLVRWATKPSVHGQLRPAARWACTCAWWNALVAISR
jgi:uncharacterized Tic20 family protein